MSQLKSFIETSRNREIIGNRIDSTKQNLYWITQVGQI